MSDYYRNYNDCIRSDNLEAIELALTRILEQEGYRCIPSPPQPPPNLDDLWIVGLFPGAAGWRIVKTSPPELLCSRAQGTTKSEVEEFFYREKLFKLDEQMDELFKSSFQLVDEALGKLLGGTHSHWELKEKMIWETLVFDYRVSFVDEVYKSQQQLEAKECSYCIFNQHNTIEH